jgi:hypothetical protein
MTRRTSSSAIRRLPAVKPLDAMAARSRSTRRPSLSAADVVALYNSNTTGHPSGRSVLSADFSDLARRRAVGSEHIGRVIGGIELRPQPWRAIIFAAISKHCPVGLVHCRLVLRGERDVKLGTGGL